jgi:hypothetical protein
MQAKQPVAAASCLTHSFPPLLSPCSLRCIWHAVSAGCFPFGSLCCIHSHFGRPLSRQQPQGCLCSSSACVHVAFSAAACFVACGAAACMYEHPLASLQEGHATVAKVGLRVYSTGGCPANSVCLREGLCVYLCIIWVVPASRKEACEQLPHSFAIPSALI